MKKYLQISCSIILMMITISLNAQNIYIPDANFKNALIARGVDLNSDGEIQESEALEIDTLKIKRNNIENLTGIESFLNLNYLDLTGNKLTSLNINNLPEIITLNCPENKISSINLFNLPKLKILDLSNNKLTALDLSEFTSLEIVFCFWNNLISLDLKNLNNLTDLRCNSNKLTSLDLSKKTQLNLLDCSYNQLINLDISTLTNLEVLYCRSNQIKNLELKNLSNLTNLSCTKNQLTSLDVSMLSHLKEFYCDENKLTYLDVSNLYFLVNFNCSYNPLELLIIKNGVHNVFDDVFTIFEAVPNLKYICADASEIDELKQMAILAEYPYISISSFCNSITDGTYYTIYGQSKIDGNNNGCGEDDMAYPNLKIKISNATVSEYIISSTNGNFYSLLDTDTYTFQPILNYPNYYSVNPESATFTIPDTVGPSFCIAPNGVHNDLSVSIIPTVGARPGFSDATYKVVYKNQGTSTQNGSVTFNYDEAKMNFITSSPIANNTSNGKMSFNFNSLTPFETRSAFITMRTNSPSDNPAVNSGDVLEFTATIIAATDETPEDNLATLSQTVVGSFDPNDKTCLEGEIVSPELIGKNVHYLIRFENEGTANAENIVVTDYIDTTVFDINTLQITDASHICHTQISQGNKVQFIFSDIQLPFSEPDKHGHVAFSIKLKDNLVIGDSIQNKADIYFDYNLPVTTNKAISEINNKTVTFIGRNNSLKAALDIYPNPSNGQFSLDLKADINSKVQISILNIEGKVVFAREINHQQHSLLPLNLKSLAKGVYLIKAQIGNDVFSKKVVIQ